MTPRPPRSALPPLGRGARPRGPAALLAAIAIAVVGAHVHAAPEGPGPLVFAIVVGNNEGTELLPQLHYADDDALRFYRLAVRLAPKENVALLTELDVDTWRSYQLAGSWPPPFLPPTKEKLLEVIALFKRQIARARLDHPERPVHFYFFFSGHGERGYFLLKKDGGALSRSAFTGEDLERTFSDSKATLNGLFIDACKAQSLFTKGAPVEDDELGPDFSGLIQRLDRTASRAPIGVLTSTVSDQVAGEARDIRGGYFSHVLTSGLSGAADSNSDGVVRYGELAAFVAFHTRRLAGQRPWFRPPSGDLSASLVRLTGRTDLLEIPPGLGGHFAIFDARGRDLLLEVHKTSEQWTRLILPPGRYQVILLASKDRGHLAEVELRPESPVRVARASFSRSVSLGRDLVPRGEGLGAPGADDDAESSAIAAFDPDASGFDQPFTPRVVSALAVAYGSGLTAGVSHDAGSTAPRERRHSISVGYGFLPPPMDPISAGHGVTVAYSMRPIRPLRVGARALLAFSSHVSPGTSLPYEMKRLALQAEAQFAHTFLSRFEVSAGAYIGWQLVLLTQDTLLRDAKSEKEWIGTTLTGDPRGLRVGLMAELRFAIARGLEAILGAGWGAEVIHAQEDSGGTRLMTFLRPQVLVEVGYAF
jgi:hypothetical protein